MGASLIRVLGGDSLTERQIRRMASAAGIDVSTIMQILRGEIDHPPARRLRGFAEALGISYGRLVDAVVRDGANRENYTR